MISFCISPLKIGLIILCESGKLIAFVMLAFIVDQIFDSMSECQALNPDEEDDFSGIDH
jgi:hypothetical protein